MIPILLFFLLFSTTQSIQLAAAGTFGLLSVKLFHRAWLARAS